MRHDRLFLAALLVLAGVPWFLRADTVLFKDGFIIHGKLLKHLEPIIDPNGGAVYIPAPGRFFELDDEARRFIIVPRQVQDARSGKLNPGPDFVEIERGRTNRTGHALDPVFEVIDTTPWNKLFQRKIRLRVPRKGQDEVSIDQRMTLLTPNVMRVEGLSYNWVAYYLTRELEPEVVRKLLHQHFGSLVNKPGNDPKENRLKVCRFLSQAGWHELAEKEMDQVVKDLPDLKESVDKLRERVARAKAGLFVEALERADKAGQREAVRRKLEEFFKGDLPKVVDQKVLLDVQDLKSRHEATDAKLKEAGRLLDAFVGRVVKDGGRPALREAGAALQEGMHPDLLPRLEAFVSQGQQWEKDEKAGRETQHGAEGILSLAVTGWLLGSSAAEASPGAAEKLWKARTIMLRYLNTPALPERQALAQSWSPNEQPATEVIAQMIRYLPPADPIKKAVPGVQEIKAVKAGGRKITYHLQLPPEYHPSRSYPVLLVLHSSSDTAPKMLAKWADLAAKNGYILAAPQWGGPFQATYQFSTEEHAIVLNCLRDLKRHFHVDSERIFLFGMEQGGFFAYDVGLSHPSLFAGVLTMAASPYFFIEGYWSNAQHLPLYIVEGGSNGVGSGANRKQFKDYVRCGYPALYVEYKGRGPEWFAGELPSMMDWMNRKKRFHPLRQVGVAGRGDSSSEEFRTMRPGDGPFYWLSVDQIARNHLNTFANWQRTISPARVQAAISDDNKILVNTKGVNKVTIWLSPGMIDFTKKVRVKTNLAGGEAVSVQPRVETMLEDYYERGDREKVFVARLTIKP
jgi:predicted esterase